MAAPTTWTPHEIEAELDRARARVAQLEHELSLASSSVAAAPPRPPPTGNTAPLPVPGDAARAESTGAVKARPLSLREYRRYGRQMMLPQVGLPGQLKLKHAHVLVVGAGGLGCPVLLYLAAAGVGEITILDHDTVELSNLHRQVLHTEARIGMSKAQSARLALNALNSDIIVHAHELAFTPALFHPSGSTSTTPDSVVSGTFTLVVDCTDNPATRHFLNAYAVAHGLPLVSGGAVRAEGVVGVYGLPLSAAARPSSSPTATTPGKEPSAPQGPCYACLFPPDPAPAAPPSWDHPPATPAEQRERERAVDAYYERLSLSGTGACADEGVLGLLCGVVGLGMASEAIKVLLGIASPTLQLFSPLSTTPYRIIKPRGRKLSCPTCGILTTAGTGGDGATTPETGASESSAAHPTTTTTTPASRWEAFLASPSGTWPGWIDPLCTRPGIGSISSSGVLPRTRPDVRIPATILQKQQRLVPRRPRRHIVVDTRPGTEFAIARLEGSVNIPFPRLLKNPALALEALSPSPARSDAAGMAEGAETDDAGGGEGRRITFLCRRGNDSLLAARALRRHLDLHQPPHVVDEKAQKETASAGHGLPHYGVSEIEVDDLRGGLAAWVAEVDPEFPIY